MSETEPSDWYQRPLGVTLIGIIAAAAITAATASVTTSVSFSRWMERTDLRIAATERRTAELASDQEAGRLRGDDRQAQINAVTRNMSTIESNATNDRRILLRLEDKVDQLLSRQFGANQPPN